MGEARLGIASDKELSKLGAVGKVLGKVDEVSPDLPPVKQSLGPNDLPQRFHGPWTKGDLSRASNGQDPIDMIPTTNRTGRRQPLELHHGDQMPGSGVHE